MSATSALQLDVCRGEGLEFGGSGRRAWLGYACSKHEMHIVDISI